ncbi:prepilin-type N-terminal cleavage/methylation domain-containing protein [Salinibacterium sp.]|uniref:type IV pilus modification PilV family protein n=1 Tax=Salinibacterium sp. TaxID=1915057 RepID=UPI00286BF8CC|nr:prepilin-type N-terminal cleavage/methylation domain-containing protein [Salinibacterium sp.]
MKRLTWLISNNNNADRGMTLIEVIVAISIMAIVATSAITLSISSVSSTTVGQRQQVAVAIASNTMETVTAHTLVANNATGESRIFDGRTQARVAAAWTASPGFPGVDTTYQMSDMFATTSSRPDLAIDTDFPANDPTPPTVLNGTRYRVRTLIGLCFQKNSGGNCDLLAGRTGASPEPDGYSKLIRVMVIVSWTAGEGCASGSCTYQTTTLLDPHLDLKWKIDG